MGVGTPVEGRHGAPQAFGIDAARIGVRTIDLSVSRVNERQQFGASSALWAADASSDVAALDVRLNDQTGGAIPFSRGLKLEGIEFDTAYFSNAAQPNETITLLYIKAGPGFVSFGNATDIVTPSRIVSGSVAIVAGLNPLRPVNRARRWLDLTMGAFGSVAIGDGNMTIITQGHLLSVLGVYLPYWRLETSDAVFAFATGINNINFVEGLE